MKPKPKPALASYATQNITQSLTRAQKNVRTLHFQNQALRGVMSNMITATIRLTHHQTTRNPSSHRAPFSYKEVFLADFGNDESGPLPCPCVITSIPTYYTMRHLPAATLYRAGYMDVMAYLREAQDRFGPTISLDHDVVTFEFERHFDMPSEAQVREMPL